MIVITCMSWITFYEKVDIKAYKLCDFDIFNFAFILILELIIDEYHAQPWKRG